jgi:hypothetical protein
MSSPETEVAVIDYAECVAPRLDAYGIAASGAAANAISNSYYYYATTHKPELPQLPVEELGELVLDEKQTMNVLQALHAICGQRNKLAKQAYESCSPLEPYQKTSRNRSSHSDWQPVFGVI